MLDYATLRGILKEERLPAVIVDLDAFDRNARKLAALAESHAKTIRIATKSIRVPELIARQIHYGKPYAGLMCYSAEEALVLARQGLDDLLVAYPTVRKSDFDALKKIREIGKRVALVLDSLDGLLIAHESFREADRPLPILLEMDASLRLLGGRIHLGVRRSPLRGLSQLKRILDEARELRGVKVIGAMVYEAQVAGLGDRNPFKKRLNPLARLVRRLSARSVARMRADIPSVFQKAGAPLEILNGGGTGSFDWACAEPALTEVTAGSALLSSHLFDYYSNIGFEAACFFALQAVRSSDEGYVTCQGGGYIASGEPGWDRVPIPVFPEGARLLSTEGCGEVQTPLRLPEGVKVAPGEPVIFRHAKAGELAERFNEYLLVSGGKIVGRAKTYRGLGHSFY